MNISSSISQVIYQTQLPGKILLKRAYIWPNYNAGNIEKIHPVNDKAEPNLNYIKRSSYDTAQYSVASKTTNDVEYAPKGYVQSSRNNYSAGSFFEAFA